MNIKSYIGPSNVYESKAFTFEGVSNISFSCLNPTNKIIFHAKDLIFKKTKLHSIGVNTSYPLDFSGKIDYDLEKDFLILNLDNKCELNKSYKLELVYQGSIAETLYGYYRSSYTDSLGKTH